MALSAVAPPFQPLNPMSRAILDSVPAHIAVIDAKGTITLVNKAWVQFAKENGDPELCSTGIGANYFAACRLTRGPSVANAQQVLNGMLSIVRGERSDFEFEYPCHSATEERWFLMHVQPLVGVPGSLVISHMNTTARQRVKQAEAEARANAAKLAQIEEELRWFERLFGSGVMLVTAQTFGLGSVRDKHPEFFQEFVQRYETVLDLALEQRVYKVKYQITEQIRLLGEQLGFLRAGPRDVIEVHSTALQNKTAKVPVPKAQVYTQEARLVAMELMGDLVLYYRTLAMGKRATTFPQDIDTGGGEQGE